MSEQIVIVDHIKDWKDEFPKARIITTQDYISRLEYFKIKNVRLINFSRSYRYLSMGYYCSLLAQARNHKIIPAIKTITDLSSKSIYSLNFNILDAAIQKVIKEKYTGHSSSFTLHIFFGEATQSEFTELGRQIFEMFTCPILQVTLKNDGKWSIFSITPGALHSIPQEQIEFFITAFSNYSSKRWKSPRAKPIPRYDLAILMNPNESMPPSNKRALKKFERVGQKLGLRIDFLEKKDFTKLAEYDALFIRETTQINLHTFKFAKKAENEGMVVIDNTDSIVKCTNKIYLFELFTAQKIPMPKTRLLKKDAVSDPETVIADLGLPLVLKIPDSSFSKGIYKIKNKAELQQHIVAMFSESDILIAQEYVYTEFDWRIGILNKKPIFACQYFMSRHHWQIVKHSSNGRFHNGKSTTWSIDEVPQYIIETAVKAANLIGDGLYGVDLKEINNKVMVMEINDNPNIDAGVEDLVLGDELYSIVLNDFIRRLDLRKAGKNTAP